MRSSNEALKSPAKKQPHDDPDSVSALRQLGAIVVLDSVGDVKNVDFSGVEKADVALLHIKRLVNLRMLFLGRTAVTDGDLSHLVRCPDITILDLYSTLVSDVGLAYVEKLQKLEWLNLDRTQVTDEGINHLVGLTHLRWLSLRETQVTDEGRVRMRQALPDITIPQDADGA